MKSTTFILFFIILFSLKAQMNTDTIWFDSDWIVSSKSDAEYFRPPMKKENSGFNVKDYFITGELQMEAFSGSPDIDEFEGLVKWYDKSGKCIKKSTYKSGELEGESINFVNGKKYKAIYKANRFYSGTMVYNNPGGFYKIEAESGFWTNRKIYFDEKHEHLRMEELYSPKDSSNTVNEPYKIRYYSFDGSQIGEMNYDENQIGNGEYVYYFEGENSHHIKVIHHVKEGRTVYTDYNYPNGFPKVKGKQGEHLVKFYYDEKGNLLDSLIFKDNYAFEGSQIVFSSKKDGVNDFIKQRTWYKNGHANLGIEYNEKGIEIKRIEYEKQFNIKKLEIERDSNGVVVNKLIYKNGAPFEGSFQNKYHKKEYKEGKLTELIEYYDDGSTIFKHQKSNRVKFYSKSHEIIGELEIDSTSYGSPISGKQIQISNDKIYRIEEYKDAFKIKLTEFDFKEDLCFKSEVFFERNDRNYTSKYKRINYYSNGNKRNEVHYENGYTEIRGEYFNQQGEHISTYLFKEKEGTKYEFFDRSDIVESVKTYEKGELIKEKVYKKHYPDNSTENVEIILLRELDVNTKGVFYDLTGEYLSEITFKNKKPFTGTVYDEYTTKSVQFLEGKKHGKAITYRSSGGFNEIKDEVNYVNDKKEGIKTIYYYTGELEKTEMYSQDKLNGEVISYLKDGTQYKVIYKDDKPVEGEIIEKLYGRISLLKKYKNGDLLSKIKFNKAGNIEYDYSESKIQVQKYYPESKIVKYRLEKNKEFNEIDGKVVRYNKKGDELHKGILKNNKLISGEIWLGSTNSYSSIPTDYCLKAKRTETNTELKMYNNKQELIFTIIEKNDSEFSIINRKTTFNLDYITEEQLY